MLRACEPKKPQRRNPIRRRPAIRLAALNGYGFLAAAAIVTHIISTGVTPLHCALASHSPQLISPRFLFSSTREIPPSEKCSRECHAFSSDGVHSHLAFSASRSAPRHRRPITGLQSAEISPNNTLRRVQSHCPFSAFCSTLPLCGCTRSAKQ